MANVLITVTALLCFIGCVTDSGEKLPDPVWVSVTSIKSATIVGKTVQFTVVCWVPEPCWRYARSNVKFFGQFVAIGVYVQRTTSEQCAQVLTSIDVPVNITVPSAGTYTFQFTRLETTADTTMTIP